MVTKKNKKPVQKTAHVSAAVQNIPAQKEECACGADCKCGCNSGCKCEKLLPFFGMVLIALSVIASPFIRPCTLGLNKPAAPTAKISEDAIRNFIKANPKVILDSVNSYYQKQQGSQAGRKAPPKKADSKMIAEILADKTNTVLGNPKGTFVIIEFFDYQCGYCKMMNKKLAEAIKKSDNIRWVLMDNPIFGEKSETISRYAMAADKQGKFAEYHEALGDNKDMSEAGLIALGKKLGLNTDKLTKDANSKELKDKLLKTREYTKELNLSGVPMFIIDGDVQPGAFQDAQLEEYIKKANDMKKTKKAKK